MSRSQCSTRRQDAEDTDEARPAVIGNIAGPGSGTGTQCERICQSFRVEHIGIEHVLRADMDRRGSPETAVIRQNMRWTERNHNQHC